MRHFPKVPRPSQFLTFALFLAIVSPRIPNILAAQSQSPDLPAWRADHHMHVASPKLCALIGERLESNNPPAVFAADTIAALDQAHISKGVILSCAYLYGLPSFHLKPAEIAAKARLENEFTAAQVAKYPDRLVGFLSVDPLTDSAIDEIRHWHGNKQLIGLKLHFTASAVDVRSGVQRRKVAEVIAAAATEHLPMVIHVGGGKFNAADAELFIRDVLPGAGSSWIQIAHAGGGLPRENDNNLAVLRTFADHPPRRPRDTPGTLRYLLRSRSRRNAAGHRRPAPTDAENRHEPIPVRIGLQCPDPSRTDQGHRKARSDQTRTPNPPPELRPLGLPKLESTQLRGFCLCRDGRLRPSRGPERSEWEAFRRVRSYTKPPSNTQPRSHLRARSFSHLRLSSRCT